MLHRRAALARLGGGLLLPLLPAGRLVAEDKPLDFGRLEAAVADELKSTNTPGAAVAVVHGGRVAFAKGFGVASVETNVPVTADTLFRIGSTTKMFTAAAAVQLAEAGQLDLDAPVEKYVKDLPTFARPLTTGQLLSHHAGLADFNAMQGPQDDAALGRTVRDWKDALRLCDPGRVFSYSNPGYWLAGLVVETVAGSPFADRLAEAVFEPLGMKRTTFRPTLAMTYPLAQGHQGGAKPTVVRPQPNNAGTWPAGSMYSSAHDLARWAVAFVNGGKLDGKEVLSPKGIDRLSKPRVPVPGSTETHYGYGLMVGPYRGVRTLEHGGSRPGYGSQIRFLPDQKAAVIVVVNKSGGTLPKTMRTATELVAPLKEPTPEPGPAAPPTDEEKRKLVGTYRNGLQRIEVRLDDGKLRVQSLQLRGELTRLAGDRYRVGGGSVTFVPGKGGEVEFLSSGSRAFRRVE